MIEANGGPEGLDLSGKDLSGIDLGRKAIKAELEKVQGKTPDEIPVWYNDLTEGVNLKGVNLRGAKLQRANLWFANLQRADLGFAKLQRADLLFANLQGAVLLAANLQGADLAVANLQGAILTGANLQKAHLAGGAKLQRADLVSANLQEANLGLANLQGARLGKANFKEAVLRYSHLEKVDFFGAEGLEGAYFYNAFLDNTRMRKDQLGKAIGEERDEEYDKAKEAYLALKNNFAEIGRYDDESWAYIKERQMGKMCSAPWRARRFYGASQLGDTEESKLPTWHPRVLWFYASHIRRWARDWIEELLCKYGESLRRALGWMIAEILGFAAYYWHIGGVWLVEANGGAKVATSFWHYLIYSAGAFTTTGFARFQAADDRVRMVTAFQAIIGIVLAGLLGFVAGNRIRRS